MPFVDSGGGVGGGFSTGTTYNVPIATPTVAGDTLFVCILTTGGVTVTAVSDTSPSTAKNTYVEDKVIGASDSLSVWRCSAAPSALGTADNIVVTLSSSGTVTALVLDYNDLVNAAPDTSATTSGTPTIIPLNVTVAGTRQTVQASETAIFVLGWHSSTNNISALDSTYTQEDIATGGPVISLLVADKQLTSVIRPTATFTINAKVAYEGILLTYKNVGVVQQDEATLPAMQVVGTLGAGVLYKTSPLQLTINQAFPRVGSGVKTSASLRFPATRTASTAGSGYIAGGKALLAASTAMVARAGLIFQGKSTLQLPSTIISSVVGFDKFALSLAAAPTWNALLTIYRTLRLVAVSSPTWAAALVRQPGFTLSLVSQPTWNAILSTTDRLTTRMIGSATWLANLVKIETIGGNQSWVSTWRGSAETSQFVSSALDFTSSWYGAPVLITATPAPLPALRQKITAGRRIIAGPSIRGTFATKMVAGWRSVIAVTGTSSWKSSWTLHYEYYPSGDGAWPTRAIDRTSVIFPSSWKGNIDLIHREDTVVDTAYATDVWTTRPANHVLSTALAWMGKHVNGADVLSPQSLSSPIVNGVASEVVHVTVTVVGGAANESTFLNPNPYGTATTQINVYLMESTAVSGPSVSPETITMYAGDTLPVLRFTFFDDDESSPRHDLSGTTVSLRIRRSGSRYSMFSPAQQILTPQDYQNGVMDYIWPAPITSKGTYDAQLSILDSSGRSLHSARFTIEVLESL